MKLIVAGTRTFGDTRVAFDFLDALAKEHEITEVVSGGCCGADMLGERWAYAKRIPIKLFPADWEIGRKAGPIRNQWMADYADALCAFWDGKSRGTKDMIAKMRAKNAPVFMCDIGKACT